MRIGVFANGSTQPMLSLPVTREVLQASATKEVQRTRKRRPRLFRKSWKSIRHDPARNVVKSTYSYVEIQFAFSLIYIYKSQCLCVCVCVFPIGRKVKKFT